MNQFHDPMKTDALQNLVDTLLDVNEGYDVLIDRADASVSAKVRPLAERHAQDIDALRHEMRKSMGAPDMSGSFMRSVHKSVVALRDTFTGLHEDVLDAVTRGEDRVLSAYDTAIQAAPVDSNIRKVLIDQRSALSDEISSLARAA